MPNWVYNNLTVTGTRSELDAVAEQMNASYTRAYNATVFDEREGKLVLRHEVVTEHDPVFSFWNIISPDPSIMDEYSAVHRAEGTRTGWLPDLLTIAGSPLAEVPDGPISNHWYDWNVRNWGTKWDAGDVSSERHADDHLTYNFSTAWSPPVEAITTLSKQHPTVSFTLESEEEQGWGVELEFRNGEQTVLREWDIPDSHAEHEEHDRPCVCEFEDDQQYWYDDCPRQEVAA